MIFSLALLHCLRTSDPFVSPLYSRFLRASAWSASVCVYIYMYIYLNVYIYIHTHTFRVLKAREIPEPFFSRATRGGRSRRASSFHSTKGAPPKTHNEKEKKLKKKKKTTERTNYREVQPLVGCPESQRVTLRYPFRGKVLEGSFGNRDVKCFKYQSV